jgi:hypothetical protein
MLFDEGVQNRGTFQKHIFLPIFTARVITSMGAASRSPRRPVPLLWSSMATLWSTPCITNWINSFWKLPHNVRTTETFFICWRNNFKILQLAKKLTL